MPKAHQYYFIDGCPTDWLCDGQDDTWHTIVTFVFQSDPNSFEEPKRDDGHEELLTKDNKYMSFVSDLEKNLPNKSLAKWKRGIGYRRKFCLSFAEIYRKYQPSVAAYSFQEKTLRASKDGVLSAYNKILGGIEGKGIGFEEYNDAKGRHQMKHSFVNFHGLHEIHAPLNQMLVLIFMSWWIADQYVFHRKFLHEKSRGVYDDLAVTIVSDKLSGDDDIRRKSELNLRNLVDSEIDGEPLFLTRSPESDVFSADLIVDNMAGWLNEAIRNPQGEFGDLARLLVPAGAWNGWYILCPSTREIRGISAIWKLIYPDLVPANI